MNELHYLDEFLSKEEFDYVENQVQNCHWTFIGTGKELDETARRFWFGDLSHNTSLIEFLKNKMEQFLNVKIVPHRIYVNGQAHGQAAHIHRDTDETDGTYCSLVFYVHRNWKPEYGGHLMIISDDEKTVLHSIWPKTNSAVIFNSHVKHMALDPTVYCRDQRLSIAYKFRIIK